MPDTEVDDRLRFWLIVCYGAFLLFGGDRIGHWAAPIAFSVVYVPYVGWVAARYLLALSHVRRFVRFAQTLEGGARSELLTQVEPAEVREHLHEALRRHGEPKVDGLVHHFGFSPVDRQRSSLLGWLSTTVALASLLELFRGAAPFWLWAGGGVLGTALAVAMWYRVDRLGATLEISPFALSEVNVRGDVRRLLFSQPLTLSNHSWRRRLELRATGHSGFIALPYSLVGLGDAVALLLRYGGFDQNAEPPNTALQPAPEDGSG